MDETQSWDLEHCPLFAPWTDPASGITSYILNERVAPIQQSFYFTNRSFSDDGRYLWFYCSFPPAGNAETGRTLGVADLRSGALLCFPETQFRDASPLVDGRSGEAYWCWEYAVYKRGPAPQAPVVQVNALPEDLHQKRYGERLATHLTFSADGKELFIDASLGREWCVGSLPLDGGPFRLWQVFDRCYNHAQFSPTDPDLALLAQDYWIDVATGAFHPYENRMWLLRRGEEARPIYADPGRIGHEWWDRDGRHVWYVDYEEGTEKVDIETGEKINVWPGGTVHSHADASGQYLAGDIVLRSESAFRVAFYNVATGKEVDIASRMSMLAETGAKYHIHPHPQFCAGDTYVVYTTTVRGQVDVAVARVRDLIGASA